MADKTANELLHDAFLRHQIYLLRFSGSVRNRIWSILDVTEEDLSDKIRSRLANNKGLTTSVELKRLKALMKQIKNIRSKAWKEANEFLTDEMVKLSIAETASITAALTLTLPVVIEVVQPTARLLRSIALSRPFQGQILKDWVASMEAADIRQIHNSIQLGMIAGEDMATIARRVVGTRALSGADGAVEMTRRQVAAVTRTAVMHVSNAARTAFFHENSDIVTQEYFVATLDSRTTPVCRANDGKAFPLGKGPVPPLHFNCRSLRIAQIDGTLLGDRPAKPFTEKQLLRQYADDNGLGEISNRRDLPRGTRGDYDKWRRKEISNLVGPIPASTTYQKWLQGQSKSFQDDILGVNKAKLFRDGGLTLDKFVNRNGDELTLSQLAKTEKEAFRAAGLNPDDF